MKAAASWVGWTAALVGLLVAWFAEDLLRVVPWGLLLTLPCLTFALAGRTLARLRHRIRAPVIVGTLLLTSPLMLAAANTIRPVDIRSGDFGTPLFSVLAAMTVSAGLALLGSAINLRAGSRSGRLVKEMAAGSVLVMLIHVPLFYLFIEVGLSDWATFCLSVVLAYLLSALVRSTAASLPLTGTHPRRASERSPTEVSSRTA